MEAEKYTLREVQDAEGLAESLTVMRVLRKYHREARLPEEDVADRAWITGAWDVGECAVRHGCWVCPSFM